MNPSDLWGLSGEGIFARMVSRPTSEHNQEKMAMIASTRFKHIGQRVVCVSKRGCGSLFCRAQGGMSAKLKAIGGSQCEPLKLFATAGHFSEHICVLVLASSLLRLDSLSKGRGYNTDYFKEALKEKGTRTILDGRRLRKEPIKCDESRYERCDPIKIILGSLKNWRCAATRYDRLPKLFLAASA